VEDLKLQRVDDGDLRPIHDLPRLSVVEIQDASTVRDFSPLATLPELNWVFLDRATVGDLSFLAHGHVTVVSLTNGVARDLSPLAQIPTLVHLTLEGESTDLTTLTGPPSLQQIDLTGSAVPDLTPLFKLPGLHIVHACNHPSSPAFDASVAALRSRG